MELVAVLDLQRSSLWHYPVLTADNEMHWGPSGSAVHMATLSSNPWKSAFTTLPDQPACTGLRHVLAYSEKLGVSPALPVDSSDAHDICTSVTHFIEAARRDTETKASILG